MRGYLLQSGAMDAFDPMKIVLVLVPMLLSLTVHEYFHAWMAHKLGDDTAVQAGRLTLNPVAHIDPVGTLLIPVIGLSTGAPFFGWAKPVPVSPYRFTRKMRMKTGILLTSVAGPLSNMAFALIMALVLSAVAHAVGFERLVQEFQSNRGGVLVAVIEFLRWMVLVNVGLCVFNLLPIPPLDGSGVLTGLLPDRYQHVLEWIGRYSFVLFIAILLVGGKVIGAPVLFIVGLISSLVGFPIL